MRFKVALLLHTFIISIIFHLCGILPPSLHVPGASLRCQMKIELFCRHLTLIKYLSSWELHAAYLAEKSLLLATVWLLLIQVYYIAPSLLR